MLNKSLHIRKLFLRSATFSSSFTSQARCNNQYTSPQSPFYGSAERTSIFQESVEQLCHQKRLKDAVLLLESEVRRVSTALYVMILQLCVEQRALEEGRRVHAYIQSSGFVPGIFITNKILDLYFKCGSINDAQKLFDRMSARDICSWNILISGYGKMGRVSEARKAFDEMPQRDNFSWTAMISGYVKHKQPEQALELYRTMQRNEKFNCNKFTVSSALAASAAIQSLRLGKEIHGHIMRTGVDSDAVLLSALSGAYGKNKVKW